MGIELTTGLEDDPARAESLFRTISLMATLLEGLLQVEPSAQVEACEGASFEQSVAKFENDPNATKVAESGILGGLRVYDRNAVG
jgi:hypothetical protein